MRHNVKHSYDNLKSFYAKGSISIRWTLNRQCKATVAEIVKFPYMLPAKDRLTHSIVLEPREKTQQSGIIL